MDLVFHAAAYKHVPLVEINPRLVLRTMCFQPTRFVLQLPPLYARSYLYLLIKQHVHKRMVTKRLAELVVQAHAAARTRTCFAMVRFGNVLGSSGSVALLFRQQIAAGGPITLTHPEIIRYFMTIPEAAKLLLQASVLAQGGDLFLLDMGDPVRIKDLAEQMVRLSGLSLRDTQNPAGEIEIVCTGLRPGEKLYEELLIDAVSQPTTHPLIYRAEERALTPDHLWPILRELDSAIASQNVELALKLLAELVPEWKRSSIV